MKKKKIIVLSILSFVLGIGIITGIIFAGLKDDIKTNIAINTGTAEVFAYIDDIKSQEYGGRTSYDSEDNILTLKNIQPSGRVNFNICIKNESTRATLYRVLVSFDGELKETLVVSRNVPNNTNMSKLTSINSESKWIEIAGNTEAILPMSIELPSTTDNENQEASAELVINIEAIQTIAVGQVVIDNKSYDILPDAIAAAKVGESIVVGSGVYDLDTVNTNGSLEIVEGANVTFVLGEDDSISMNKSKEINVPTIVNNGNLTIEDCTIKNDNPYAGNTNVSAIQNLGGTLTLKNCIIENNAPTSGGAYCIDVKGGKVNLENCTVKGNRGGIAISGSGAVEMVGGSITASVYYPLYVLGDATATFNEVVFKQNGSKVRAIVYNTLAEDSVGYLVFENCAFSSNKVAPFSVSNVMTGITFNGTNTFSNVTEP